ncbi:MAG: hypothetical protein GY953_35420 [bacterium]|nr:hypothetical protein [bacterium]
MVYDVIDGKQRLETIFMFLGTRRFRGKSFEVTFRFPEDDREQRYDW